MTGAGQETRPQLRAALLWGGLPTAPLRRPKVSPAAQIAETLGEFRYEDIVSTMSIVMYW